MGTEVGFGLSWRVLCDGYDFTYKTADHAN